MAQICAQLDILEKGNEFDWFLFSVFVFRFFCPVKDCVCTVKTALSAQSYYFHSNRGLWCEPILLTRIQ